MNKKMIIVSIIVFIMIFSSFVILSDYKPINNTENNIEPFAIGSGLNTYTIPIIVKNYTIPDVYYNYTNAQASANYVLTKYSPTHTLTYYYYSTSGTINEYILKTGQLIELSSAPKPYENSALGLFYPNQLTNLSIDGFGYIINDTGYIEFDYYNLYNNTNNLYLSSIKMPANLNSLSATFSDNYYYFSNETSGNELGNVWINMTTHHYYYLNISVPDWNSVNYFNYGHSWLLSSNDATNNTVYFYNMYYSKTTNNFSVNYIYSNKDTAIVGADSNNEPYIETKFSNGTVLLDGLGRTGNVAQAGNQFLYYYPNGTYKFISTLSNISTTDDIDFNLYAQNNYMINGEFLNNNQTYQNAFTDIYNNTVLLTNNSWFNNYFPTTPIGYSSSSVSTTSVLMETYFGYSGWENALSNIYNNKIMLWYNPNKVNEFTPSNTSFENIVNKYKLTIDENGLSSGTSWSYTFNGTSYSLTNNSYNYSLVNGNYALSVSSVNGYNVAYPSTITIDNTSKIAYVNFTAIPKYTVHIKENGLPSGTSWNFTIKHDSSIIVSETLSTNEYNTSLQNGTYDLYAGSESGYHLNIHTSPFTVSGSAITEYVNYSAIPTYTLYLKESGLSSGTKWIAYVNSIEYSSTNEYMNVSGLNNGTYSLSIDNVADYSLGSYPSSFTISGNNYYVNITFTHNISLYSAKFIANHVKDINSIVWSIVFNGTTYSSQNSNTIIVPSLKNGTYSLSVNNIAGYITDKYDSSVVINGVNITETINFNETFTLVINPVNYTGSFTFNLNGTSYTVSGSHSITVINGTYSFTVSSISGYSLSYNSPIIINGANYEENITFIKIANRAGYYTVEFIIIGMNPHTSWSVVINGEQYYSNTYELNISLKNGTYYPDINVPDNYILSNNGVLIVNGNNTVYYSSASQTTFGSFVQYMPYFVIFVLIIGLMAIVIAVKRR